MLRKYEAQFVWTSHQGNTNSENTKASHAFLRSSKVISSGSLAMLGQGQNKGQKRSKEALEPDSFKYGLGSAQMPRKNEKLNIRKKLKNWKTN